MYLNIINNINIENNRKNKNYSLTKEEKVEDENNLDDFELEPKLSLQSYYSIFYGELTNNWIYLRS